MAVYWTNFEEYTTDQQPSDWTERYGDYDHVVREEEELSGGKFLEIRANGNTDTATHFISWDIVNSDVNRDNFEILKRVRFTVDKFNNNSIGMGRVNNSFANRDVYGGTFQSGNGYVTLEKWVNGSYSLINNVTGFTYDLDTLYWMRVRVNGTTIQAKYWEDGTEEPEGWDNTDVDSSITDAGWIGWGTYQDRASVDIDVFVIATDGETAPMEEPSGEGEDQTITVTDSASGSDSVQPEVSLSVSDEGSGDDSPSPSAQTTVQDSATGLDALQALVVANVSDVALSEEGISVQANVVTTDSGQFVDVVSVLVSVLKQVQDSGSFTDSTSVDAEIKVQDLGQVSEVVGVFVDAIRVSDTAQVVEVVASFDDSTSVAKITIKLKPSPQANITLKSSDINFDLKTNKINIKLV